MKDLQQKQIIKGIVLTVLGTLLLSIGTAVFILPYGLVTGGISGLAIIASSVIPLTKELLITVITVALYVFGAIFLNKSFAAKTLLSTIVYPIGVAVFSKIASPDFLRGFFYIPASEYSEIGILLAALFGGIFIGAGCAITFIGGGSTGGVDIIAFIICKYFKKVKSSAAIFVIDALIIIVGAFVSHNIVITLLGIICAFVTAIVIDKMFLGQTRAFVANIVSTEHERINRSIIEKLDRTTTVIDTVGGYTGNKGKMLVVSFTMNQYAGLINIINQCDKYAFVTIYPAHEINGEGFTRDAKK